jgi:hypothetical protein
MASGSFQHRGFTGGFGAGRVGDHHFHRHFVGFPVFLGGFGLGFGLGLAAYDPWFYGAPYYGYYGYYDYPPPPAYYGPPPPSSQAAPPPAAAEPPAACGSWSWDAAKQVYNWVPC